MSRTAVHDPPPERDSGEKGLEGLEELARKLSADRLLDAAAVLACHDPRLADRVEHVRAALSWEAHVGAVADHSGGEPRAIVTHDELSSFVQAEITSQAIAAIWSEQVLEPSEAARVLGAKPSNRERVRALRARSILVGLHHAGRYLYPAFQFEIAKRRVYPEVRRVNERLDAAGDPWGVASWWTSPNDYLDARPMDLVGTADAAALVRVADDLVAPTG